MPAHHGSPGCCIAPTSEKNLLATRELALVHPGLSVLLEDIAPWQRTALVVDSVGGQQQREG